MLITEIYEALWLQYCRFLSKDLIIAFDKTQGRNEKVIKALFDTFYVVTTKQYENTQKEQAVKQLTKIVSAYLKHLGNYQTEIPSIFSKLNCSNRIFNYNAVGKLIYLTNNMNKFFTATAKYNELFQSEILRQSMIEFNNAMCHMYVSFYGSDTKTENNMKKADTHIYRGAIDYYKTIIMKKYDMLSDDEKNQLIDIRIDELNTVGLTTDTPNKVDVYERYEKIVDAIISRTTPLTN